MNSAALTAGIGWHTYILEHATNRPNDLAWVGPEEALTFKQLAWRAGKWAAQLQRDGVQQDQIVMTRFSKGNDLIATLALSMLGATAVSNTAKQYYDFEPHTDWLLTRELIPNYPTEKQIVLTPIWQQRAMNNTDTFVAPGLRSKDSIARIALTSGTTGRPKAVSFSHELLMGRAIYWQQHFPAEGLDLHLSDMGTVGGAFRPFTTLIAGFPSAQIGGRPNPRAIVEMSKKYPLVHLGGSSVQAEQFLQYFLRTPFDFSHLKTIRVGGSTVPVSLQRSVQERFGFSLHIGYGSTEAGFVTSRAGNPAMPAQNVGPTMPGVEIQIVDSDHNAVAEGELGRVRSRGPLVAAGYRNDPAATAAHFRDGWFYPGDMGQILPDGSLLLGGREAELINLGGVKIDPYLLDEMAQSELGVTEVAAFAFSPMGGTDRLGIAIAGVDKVKSKGFEKALAKKYPVRGDIFYLYLKELPRNAMGKVERKTLAGLAVARN